MASILVIGPHPDDQELGHGRIDRRLVGLTGSPRSSSGHDQWRADAARHPQRRVPLRPRRRRKSSAWNARCWDCPTAQVVHSIEARHRLAAVIRVHRPDWIFLPYPVDAHPDHVAVTRIGEDARFDAKLTKTDIPGDPWYPKRIIYYYCTHLRMNFVPTFCLDITAHMDTKIAAVNAYSPNLSQNHSPVPEMRPHSERLLRRPHRHRLRRALFHARGAGLRRPWAISMKVNLREGAE